MKRAYIGLGSNQGDPELNLKKALNLIDGSDQVRVIAVSSLYLTEPVGYEDQPWFYNCVAEVETALSPQQLLARLHQIENNLGRVRDIRWGPRTLDLDILLYEGYLSDNEYLTLPHPRMRERAFVMVPLAEIAGDALFPDGLTAQEVRDMLDGDKKFSCIPKKLW